jgi:deazaflavin-dependent oxidoreductase (nitroreductase family)
MGNQDHAAPDRANGRKIRRAEVGERRCEHPPIVSSLDVRVARGKSHLCAKIESMEQRFQEPGWFTKNVFNRIVAGLTRIGISVAGSRVLEVRGRKSGEWRRTPVNLLTHEGDRYLVAPRGHTQWVRNLRASGEGRLVVGPRTEEFTASEVGDEEKSALLRAYLKKWKWEVGTFFGGVGPDSSDDELHRIAPDHPVFRIID